VIVSAAGLLVSNSQCDRWEAYSALPDLLAGFNGATSKGREGDVRGGEGTGKKKWGGKEEYASLALGGWTPLFDVVGLGICLQRLCHNLAPPHHHHAPKAKNLISKCNPVTGYLYPSGTQCTVNNTQ